MAINANIPLSAQVVDLNQPAGNILQAVALKQQRDDQATRRKLEAAQLKEFEDTAGLRKFQTLSGIEKLTAESEARLASNMQRFVETKDFEGAKNLLMQRKQMMAEQNFHDGGYTDELLSKLENPEAFAQNVKSTIEGGVRFGILKSDKESSSDDPAAVREFKFLEQKFPDMKLGYNDYLNIKRQGYQISEIGGVPTLVARSPGVPSQPISTLEREASGKAAIAGAVEKSKDTASMQVEKQKAFPKARNTLASLEQQWNLVDDSIDRALKQIAPYSAGVGAWTKVLPASPAKDLEQTLEAIKANVGFDKLQDMRANSPTGGALGQVSDFENKLLQSVKGSLVQNQSPSQLRANLERVRNDLRQLRGERAKSFQTDFAEFLNEGAGPQPVSSGADQQPSQPASPQKIEELLRKYAPSR